MDNNKIYLDCLAFQIGLARRKVADYYESVLNPFSLTPAYVYVIGILKDDGPSTLTHIAKALNQEPATVSSLLSRMERDGFIYRSQGEERRTIKVELTPKSIAIMDQVLAQLVKADEQLDAKMGGQLHMVKQLIQRVNTIL